MRSAWSILHANHPGESFYSFGLFTSPGASYLTVTASTEEGLTVVTADYVRRYGGGAKLQRQSLRWSPVDSPLHDEGARLLAGAQAIRDTMPDPYGDHPDAEEATLEVFDVATQVLQKLEAERLFGGGRDRNRLVVGIWMGDQSHEDRIDFATPLNPRPVINRFRREMAEGLDAFKKLSKQRMEPALHSVRADGL